MNICVTLYSVLYIWDENDDAWVESATKEKGIIA